MGARVPRRPFPSLRQNTQLNIAVQVCGCPTWQLLRTGGSIGASGKGLNEAALEALMVGTGLTTVPGKRRDLSDLVGTWQPDEEFDAVLAEHDQVDEDLWK